MPLLIAMIPTWNESENIGPLLDALLALNGGGQLPPQCRLEALVVDDNSPDGTANLVRGRAEADPRIHLLLRVRDKGRGLAGIAGFREALRLGADYVIEMDADFSHDPKWIPPMAARAVEPPGADLVIGSRLVAGGGEQGRHGIRRLITLAANAYIRTMLRLPVRDATSGYRLFSRAALQAVPWNKMRATGPEVVQEVLLAVHSRGFRLAEVPILFVERRAGQSTFNGKIMLRSLGAMLRLRFSPGALVPPAADDLPVRLPAALAAPAAALYGLGRRLDRALHLRHILPFDRLPVPVLCVGNMTVGGAGKTPFVIFLARLARSMGYHPAVLTRGYGAARPPVTPMIVSDEQRCRVTPEEAGDESCHLAAELPGVPVVAHRSRAQAGALAHGRFGSNLLMLDDGFQHDALARNTDIVLWDARDLPGRQRLLPWGRLREPLAALSRASAVVITHAEYLDETERAGRAGQLRAELTRHMTPGRPIFEATTRITGFRRLSGRHGEEELVLQGEHFPWEGRPCVLLAGLARPYGFAALAKASGAVIIERIFYPDHFAYTSAEIDRWRDILDRTGAEFLLTTEKDAIKLGKMPLGGLNILSVRIGMEVEPLDPFRNWLAERLEIAAGSARA